MRNKETISAREFSIGRGRVAPKYRNERVATDDGTFDSKREHKRWGELQLLARAKEIVGLRRQVTYRFEHNGVLIATYRADFVYRLAGSPVDVVEDAKGFRTKDYLIKRQLMLAFHGIVIQEV